jgi:hypothetical protein
VSKRLIEALEYARNCLWWLQKQADEGELTLTQNQRAEIRQAEQLADDALKAEDEAQDD